ncbi:ankyrin repeat domain-containing protein [Photobacterium kishitanii]|uniref:Uncharacterized protein n=1 Tax=Photobacterium kishitanii TaxID=318456 RepID=A0A2T3KN01_9GAMM|nr:ankyrin repeat domain-containing protein [Photobacterium kishitanii]PSV01176.1 hypothetical protein C9J27_03895 [Photobacterium kishitanii]
MHHKTLKLLSSVALLFSSMTVFAGNSTGEIFSAIASYHDSDNLERIVTIAHLDSFNPYAKSNGTTIEQAAQGKDRELAFVMRELIADSELESDESKKGKESIDFHNTTYANFLRFLSLHKNIDFNEITADGYSMIHHASKTTGVDGYYILKFITDHGGNVDVPSSRGTGAVTPIQYACETDNHDAALFLLSFGADPYKEDLYGRDLLRISKDNSAEICKLIMFKAISELKINDHDK